MNCKICSIKENQQALSAMRVYEDEICVAVLSRKPTSLCHVIIFPRNHYTILEQVPDPEFGHMLNVSNKISKAMFESLNIQGTNIFIQNGVEAGQEEPHFIVHVIARLENDDVKLNWEPKKLSEEEMSTVELKYKQFTDAIVFSAEKTPEVKTEQKEEKVEKEAEKKDNAEELDYQVKYFNRLP